MNHKIKIKRERKKLTIVGRYYSLLIEVMTDKTFNLTLSDNESQTPKVFRNIKNFRLLITSINQLKRHLK